MMSTAEKWSLSVITNSLEKQITREMLNSNHATEKEILQKAHRQVNSLTTTIAELQKIGECDGCKCNHINNNDR